MSQWLINNAIQAREGRDQGLSFEMTFLANETEKAVS